MYKETSEPFSEKYPTWIIAFCPDSESFFVTNERNFFWESGHFDSEEDGVEYFEQNLSLFIEIYKWLMEKPYDKNTYGKGRVFLENTKRWYEVKT